MFLHFKDITGKKTKCLVAAIQIHLVHKRESPDNRKIIRTYLYPDPVQAIEIIGKQKNLSSLLSIT